jgi:hypothetical protein
LVARYLEGGAAIYRTDSDGAIRISIAPESGVRIARGRDEYRRYWLETPEPSPEYEALAAGAVMR